MNGDPAPATNKGVIFVVVSTLSFNATVGLSALAFCLVYKIEPNQVLLTAFISIITGLLGLIGGMLTKTAPTESTKQPSLDSNGSTPVKVTNPQSDPVPTTTAAQPIL